MTEHQAPYAFPGMRPTPPPLPPTMCRHCGHDRAAPPIMQPSRRQAWTLFLSGALAGVGLFIVIEYFVMGFQ